MSRWNRSTVAGRCSTLDDVALLYDAYGREIRDGVLKDDIIAAIQAAGLADEFETAQAIANEQGWTGLCLRCAIKAATTEHYNRHGGPWRVCITCFHELETRDTNTSGAKIYMQGLISRDVQ